MKRVFGIIFLLQIFSTLSAMSVKLTELEAQMLEKKSETLEKIGESKQNKDQVIELLNDYVDAHNKINPTHFRNIPCHFFCDLTSQNLFQDTVDSALGIYNSFDVSPWFVEMRKHVYNSMLEQEITDLKFYCACIQG